MFTVETLRKEIKDNQYMKEACAKMAHNASTFAQLISASKGFMIHSKRVDHYTEILKVKLIEKDMTKSTECIMHSEAIVRIQALRMPLLWTEESKKKESSAGCAFFVIRHADRLIDSDVIEYDTTFCEIFCSNLKIAGVDINDNIEIAAYNMWCTPGAHSKPLQKNKDEFGDPCLKFNELGKATVTIRDIIKQQEPYYSFNLNMAEDNNLNVPGNVGTFKTGTSSFFSTSRATAKLSFGKKTKESLNAAFFGSRLYFWNVASAIFTYFPKNLESLFIKFNCNISIDGVEQIMCVLFEGTNMNIYCHEKNYMFHPSKSLYIPFLIIPLGNEDGSWVTLTDPEDNKSVILMFENENMAKNFTSYLNAYKQEIEVWGKSIDTQMDSKTACHVIIDIVTKKEDLFSCVQLTPMEIGFRSAVDVKKTPTPSRQSA